MKYLMPAATIWIAIIILIPTGLTRYSAAIVAIGGFLWLQSKGPQIWSRWRQKYKGDWNELEWLNELVDEHSSGIKDHRRRIAWLIPIIEKENRLPSDIMQRHLERARHAIGRF